MRPISTSPLALTVAIWAISSLVETFLECLRTSSTTTAPRHNEISLNLAHLGVEPGRVVTISYGEDRPSDNGHGEAAWSKNRRDDFVVLTPPK